MSRADPLFDVAIVGAGQAGLAASFCLNEAGIEHIVLEQGDIAESWRSARWDSFCLVTPNWTFRLPGMDYDGDDPGGFMGKAEIIGRFEAYAASFSAPVRCHHHVSAVSIEPTTGLWQLEGSGAPIRARAVIIATATHQRPRIPDWVESVSKRIDVIHAAQYRNPQSLRSGGALVVGSGQSGTQIADELNASEREVWLAVSRVGRLPRRYRDRDSIDWQADIGFLDRPVGELDSPADRFRPDPHLTGKDGGRTLDLRELAAAGVHLTGRVEKANDATLYFRQDLTESLRFADQFAENFYRRVDEHLGDPGQTALRNLAQAPHAEIAGVGEIDLVAAGIGTVVLATGFEFDFTWVPDAERDAFGYPVTERGVTSRAGLYFLGLNYMHSRGSGIVYGVGADARYVTAKALEYLQRSR